MSGVGKHVDDVEEEEEEDDDEDYAPEEDVEEEEEDGGSGDDGNVSDGGESSAKKRKANSEEASNSKQAKMDDANEASTAMTTETAEERKARMDKLWEEMNAASPVATRKPAAAASTTPDPHVMPPKLTVASAPKEEVKVYKFAGQDVLVPVSSSSSVASASLSKTLTSTSKAVVAPGAKKGLDSLLNKFGGGKTDKLSVLDKSKLDWNAFVKKEDIADELKQHNKDGYLDKKDFLARAEQRQYELERDRRLSGMK